MRSDRVKYWLEKKNISTSELSGANLKKLTLEDQMIVSLICFAIDEGNHSAWKVLMDAAYGIMKPGEGGDKDLSQLETYQVEFNIAKDNQITIEDEIKEREYENTNDTSTQGASGDSK